MTPDSARPPCPLDGFVFPGPISDVWYGTRARLAVRRLGFMSSSANSSLGDLGKFYSPSEPQAFLIWEVRQITHAQQCCKNYECDHGR